MKEKEEDALFSHPLQSQMEAGMPCQEDGCKGTYQRKSRDLEIKKHGQTILIKDSAYWECDLCGSFLTTKEEIQRIQSLLHAAKTESISITLQIPPDLHEMLKQAAQNNQRSLDRELTHRLEQSLKENTR